LISGITEPDHTASACWPAAIEFSRQQLVNKMS